MFFKESVQPAQSVFIMDRMLDMDTGTFQLSLEGIVGRVVSALKPLGVFPDPETEPTVTIDDTGIGVYDGCGPYLIHSGKGCEMEWTIACRLSPVISSWMEGTGFYCYHFSVEGRNALVVAKSKGSAQALFDLAKNEYKMSVAREFAAHRLRLDGILAGSVSDALQEVWMTYPELRFPVDQGTEENWQRLIQITGMDLTIQTC